MCLVFSRWLCRPIKPSGLQQSSRNSSQHEARTLYASQEEHLFSLQQGFAAKPLTKGGDWARLVDLMGHESVETTRAFYAIFEQDDLRRKHDRFSGARWKT
jgi:site-specific recombinase XerD